MILRLIREPSSDGATFGSLYVDHAWACWTLEDQIREVAGQPVATWKVKGATAIPAGRYRVVITPSTRFKRLLPLLENVPGFTGVRIHPGNSKEDTDGCLLPGLDRIDGTVRRSRVAFESLFERLMGEPGEAWITIENPPI